MNSLEMNYGATTPQIKTYQSDRHQAAGAKESIILLEVTICLLALPTEDLDWHLVSAHRNITLATRPGLANATAT